MGRSQRDAAIGTARASEFLEVDACHESSKAVADKINATSANVPTQVLTQGQRALLNARTGAVVEGKDLLDSPHAKVCGDWEQRRTIRGVAVHENDGPLFGLARCAAARVFDAKRKEGACRGKAKHLFSHRMPCRSVGYSIVLNHWDYVAPIEIRCTAARVWGI